MSNNLFQKDLITVEHLTKRDVESVFEKAREIKKIVRKKGGNLKLRGKVAGLLFYEPSSRTFSSFASSMQRLGGGIIPLFSMSFSSTVKGETIEDTAKVFSSYADVLIVRHQEANSMSKFAKYASIPVISGGEGAYGEHPTQALIDMFTIKEKLGRIQGLHILIIGDLAHYRPTNSLAKLLSVYPKVKLSFASPKKVSIRKEVLDYLQERKVNYSLHENYDALLSRVDVLYVTRVKKEYMSSTLYEQIRGSYSIDKSKIKKMKKKSLVMHCLPRIDEISTEIDNDKRSVYLSDQVRNGLYVRMALIEMILKKR